MSFSASATGPGLRGQEHKRRRSAGRARSDEGRTRGTMDFNLDLSTDVLGRTPPTLQTLLGGLADPWIRGVEGPATFSPFDVVGHLIDGEETDWIPRARIILSRGPNRRFDPYDRFRHRARNVNRSLGSLLHEFA